MIARFDAWLGRTMFHPPIIWICQMTRQTQYALSKLIWFGVALYMFSKAEGALGNIFFGAVAFVAAVRAGAAADEEESSFRWLRMFIFSLMALDVIANIALGRSPLTGTNAANVAMLFAEYACTIKTIPPRRKRERKASGKAVRA